MSKIQSAKKESGSKIGFIRRVCVILTSSTCFTILLLMLLSIPLSKVKLSGPAGAHRGSIGVVHVSNTVKKIRRRRREEEEKEGEEGGGGRRRSRRRRRKKKEEEERKEEEEEAEGAGGGGGGGGGGRRKRR